VDEAVTEAENRTEPQDGKEQQEEEERTGGQNHRTSSKGAEGDVNDESNERPINPSAGADGAWER
jgi:hypothetical protein